MLSTILTTLSITTAASFDTQASPPTTEIISGLLGSVSLACWLFLLLPQLIENYRNQSAEAISLAFVLVWFLGDLCNLIGALWAGLVPVVIAIAVYFCISDGLLIAQCLYYGIRNKRREGQGLLESVRDVVRDTETGNERVVSSTGQYTAVTRPREVQGRRRTLGDDEDLNTTPTETEPLLSRVHSRTTSMSKYTIPGSADLKYIREQSRRQSAARRSSAGSAVSHSRTRRKSSSVATTSAQAEPLAKILEDRSNSSASIGGHTGLVNLGKDFAFIMLVMGVGCIGWLIAYKTGTWRPTPPPDTNPPQHNIPEAENPTSAQFLGYASAILYLTARLPQIWKNYREKSCEGLSILFFVLSLIGNATYGGGILAHSLQKDYVRKNAPWLIGSLGTIFEDIFVFVQFRIYKEHADVEQHQALIDDSAERARGADSMVRGEGV